MGLFDKLLGKSLGKKESAREERGEYYFVISYVINYLRAEVSAAATELTELNILEKAKALSYEGLGKNLLLIISKGSQDLSDDAVNSFSKQYEEYCQLFEKITGGKAYACYINWKLYSAKAATTALGSVLTSPYKSKINFEALALATASFFTLPYEIITKMEYLYMVDRYTSYLNSNFFVEVVKRLISNKTTAAWDTISYVMPVEDGTVWKNNMQVFHVFFKDALTKLPRR